MPTKQDNVQRTREIIALGYRHAARADNGEFPGEAIWAHPEVVVDPGNVVGCSTLGALPSLAATPSRNDSVGSVVLARSACAN
ncbi:MAG: hypothetical protein WCR07_11415, partial [Verrucomicrobiota bacterium]